MSSHSLLAKLGKLFILALVLCCARVGGILLGWSRWGMGLACAVLRDGGVWYEIPGLGVEGYAWGEV